MKAGDHVRKKSGMKFVGTILAIYSVPHEERKWCVVILDKNEASDHLQHLYPLDLFELNQTECVGAKVHTKGDEVRLCNTYLDGKGRKRLVIDIYAEDVNLLTTTPLDKLNQLAK